MSVLMFHLPDPPVLKICRDLTNASKCARNAAARGDSKKAYCLRRWPREKCQKWCGICTVEGKSVYHYMSEVVEYVQLKVNKYLTIRKIAI